MCKTECVFFKENKPVRQHVPWTSEEKDFLSCYAAQTPRGTETMSEYWQKCADKINVKFPGSNRKGKTKEIIFYPFLISKYLILLYISDTIVPTIHISFTI